MTRVAQRLAALTLAGGLVTGAVFTAGPALADTQGLKDGLVVVEVSKVDIRVLNFKNTNILCGNAVSVIAAIDGTNQTAACNNVKGGQIYDNKK
jgi:hypothetical protein